MIDIKINSESLDLFTNTSIKMVLNNPIFETKLIEGSYSFPFSIPWSDKNRKLFGFNEIIHNANNFHTEIDAEIFINKISFFEGILKIRSAENSKYSANLTINKLKLINIFKNDSLTDLSFGGERIIAGGYLKMLDHMEDTINGSSDDFDYVFFPIYNPDFFADKNPDYKAYINSYIKFGYKSSWGAGWENFGFLWDANQSETTHVPFPYLVYVFKQIFLENEYFVKSSFWNDIEIKTLVIYNNKIRASIYTFFLNQHVPDIKLGVFLNNIKNLFCLGYFFDHKEKSIEVIPLKDLLANEDYIDWTTKVSPKYKISQAKDKGYKFIYEHDKLDALKDTQTIFNDLIIGDGGNEIKTNISSLIDSNRIDLHRSNILGIASTHIQPFIRQLGSDNISNNFGIGQNDFGFSLLFYRGLLQDDNGDLFPVGSYNRIDFNSQIVGNYSLTFDGPYGIYEKWWKPWLNFLINTKIIKRQVMLDILDIISIDFRKKYRISDVNYFIKNINITFTMKNIEPAELTLSSI